MKNYILYVLMGLLAIGCGSEEDGLNPSRSDRDWFVIEDSDDRVGHERFLLYEKYGIPVFVNDTIGKEERGVDYYGDPVVYYYVLDMNYTVGGDATVNKPLSRKFSLIEGMDDQLAGVAFLDNYLIPALPKSVYFNSILLLDSLYEMRLSNMGIPERKNLNVYKGLMTLAVGQVTAIAKMTPDEQELQASRILGTLVLDQLKEEQLADFYMVSYDPVAKKTYYGQQVNTMAPTAWLKNPDCGVYGFLDKVKHPTADWIYTNVSKAADKEDFVMAYLQYPEGVFKDKYAAYPLILEKYELMKGLLTGMGYLAK